MPRLSISSWSLHDQLGNAFYEPTGDDLSRLKNRADGDAKLDLLDVPGELAARRIRTLEVCHFHLPGVGDEYLGRLRGACDDAGVELYSLLLDFGDIANADAAARARDLQRLRQWIDVASNVGASRVRVVGGRAEPSPEAIDRAASALAELAAYAEPRGVAVITENFQRLTVDTPALLQILDRCDGKVGLCCDLGNAEGPDKYDTLKRLLPRATSIHAKARHPEGQPAAIDQAELEQCLRMAVGAGFDGPISVISSTWAGIERVRDVVEPFTDAVEPQMNAR